MKTYNQAMEDREYGFEFQAVTDADGKELSYTINDSMMRIDLPEPLAPDARFEFNVDWEHNIIDEEAVGGRGGYECFNDEGEDGNCIFGLAQWFPRMAAYTDYTGWQNKQFLGRGEFTLEFGDYNVNLTVPSDHIVAATGVLQNPKDAMTAKQRKRMDEARTDKPIYIVTPEEAEEAEKSVADGTKTWKFKADNVRDFAWSSSRKYIWDAMLFEQDDEVNPTVTAMSFFPKEADPIWSKYSTHAVVHTMDVYNKFAFNYPYPTAQSVNSWPFIPAARNMALSVLSFTKLATSISQWSSTLMSAAGRGWMKASTHSSSIWRNMSGKKISQFLAVSKTR